MPQGMSTGQPGLTAHDATPNREPNRGVGSGSVKRPHITPISVECDELFDLNSELNN